MSVRVPGGYNPASVVITGGTAQFDDGTTSALSIAFAAAPTSGWYRDTSTGRIVTKVSGTEAIGFTGNSVILPSGGNLVWTSGGVTGTGDTTLSRGAAGIVKFASANSFSANAAVATSITSVGPTGANTTVQEWLTIKNSGGTTRYIPCF